MYIAGEGMICSIKLHGTHVYMYIHVLCVFKRNTVFYVLLTDKTYLQILLRVLHI